MQDIPALAEHLANMVTASDTPRYQSVLADNIRFLERELTAALTEARAQGAAEERERCAGLCEAAASIAKAVGNESDPSWSAGMVRAYEVAARRIRSNTGEE